MFYKFPVFRLFFTLQSTENMIFQLNPTTQKQIMKPHPISEFVMSCVTTGHKPNPFLKSVSEENDGEKDKTRPK